MTDLANRQGGFQGITVDESRRLIEKGIAIVNQNAVYGVAVSCEIREMDSLLPKWIRGFEGAYPVCCHLAMTMMGKLVAASGHDERVAYYFESGHEHQNAAHFFMANALLVPALRDSYRHHSHSFEEKDDVPQLQTADVLAWEWTKYWDETVQKRKRPMRKSLAAILAPSINGVVQYDRTRFNITHLTGAPLQKFARQVEQLGLLQMEEDRQSRVGPRRDQ